MKFYEISVHSFEDISRFDSNGCGIVGVEIATPPHVEPPHVVLQRVLPPSAFLPRRSSHHGDSDDPALLQSSDGDEKAVAPPKPLPPLTKEERNEPIARESASSATVPASITAVIPGESENP